MLQNDAMIVRLNISRWTGRKFDRQATNKVADDFDVESSVGNYRKALVAKDALKDITQLVSEARGYHYENTLPWDNAGGRLIPSSHFLKYSEKMREFKSRFEQTVQKFVDNYSTYVDEAVATLKGLFRSDDYPSIYDIEGKFGFAVDIEPVPSAKDFRISVQGEEVDRIKKELEARVNERVNSAIHDLYVRLSEVIGHFAEKLSDPESIFRDSLVENVVDLVNLLPSLNMNNDPELAKLGKETQKKLCAYEPDQLRKDPEARKVAADDAKAILDKMAGYIGS